MAVQHQARSSLPRCAESMLHTFMLRHSGFPCGLTCASIFATLLVLSALEGGFHAVASVLVPPEAKRRAGISDMERQEVEEEGKKHKKKLKLNYKILLKRERKR